MCYIFLLHRGIIFIIFNKNTKTKTKKIELFHFFPWYIVLHLSPVVTHRDDAAKTKYMINILVAMIFLICHSISHLISHLTHIHCHSTLFLYPYFNIHYILSLNITLVWCMHIGLSLNVDVSGVVSVSTLGNVIYLKRIVGPMSMALQIGLISCLKWNRPF